MKCSACKGVYHPSTGHRLGEKVVLCGPCTRDFVLWIKRREGVMGARVRNKKTGKKMEESFLDNAVRSIIGEEEV